MAPLQLSSLLADIVAKIIRIINMKIVISHHQTEYIRHFNFADIVFVFDDPTPDDLAAASDHHVITMGQAGNRSANRNAGLAYWLSQNPEDDAIIEFFDGDRFPIRYADPAAEMSALGADILLYPCEKDIRKAYAKPGTPIYIKGPGNAFFSCGFAIYKKTIDMIMAFNDGAFFSEEFKGWGGEDQYMGTVAGHLGIRCALSAKTTLNGSVGGDEGAHPDYIQAMTTYIKLAIRKGMKSTLLDNVGPLPVK